MSNRYPGGFITADEPTVNTSEADGIWTLEQQAGYQGQGVWPLSANLIQRSLRFNSADSAYLSYTPARAGNRKTWTWSGWVKRSALGSFQYLFDANNTSTNENPIRFYDDDTFDVSAFEGSTLYALRTTQVFRDVSAWYHFVVAFDTTQATASNRLKIYVNGTQITVFQTSTYPSQNTDYAINNNIAHAIGRWQGSPSRYLNGYLAEVHFVDGQALTPSSFGITNASTGVWTPIAYAGTYGQNGFYLPFNDNSAAINLGLNGIPYTTDQAWPYNTLLLNTNGTNAAQNNTFLDSSDNTFTVTRNGNTTQGRFSPFAVAEGEWSNFFDGTGDNLSFSSAVYDFGSSEDYSVEFFINFNSTSGSFGITGGYAATGTWTFNYQSGVLGIGKHFVANQLTVSQSFNIGQWYHVVACRESGTLSIFVDGTRVATTSDTTSYAATTGYIGFDGNTGWGSVNGYMSNVRVLTGGSAYTASATTLTVPTSPLTAISNTALLTCQSNRFVDNSINAYAITVNGNTSVQPFSPFTPTADYSPTVNGGSGYFDGSGDYLTAPDDAGFSLGGNNFCLEAWVYAITAPTYAQICGQFGPGGVLNSDRAYWIRFDAATGRIQGVVTNNGSSETVVTDSSVLTLNSWHHVAFVRNGNNLYLYIDGVEAGTTAFASSVHDSSHTFSIGGANNGAEIWNGYISDVRLVNGYAVYTSAFTPPTAPLTNSVPSGTTELLLNFTNAGIVDATGVNNLETVGNAQVSTSVTKWGSSVAFDGTGDVIRNAPQNVTMFPTAAFGTGDFTVECWIYLTTLNAANSLYSSRGGAENITTGFSLGVLSNGGLYIYTNGQSFNTATGVISTNTWFHVAFCRASGTAYMFVDGTQVSTGSFTNDLTRTSFAIGGNPDVNELCTGYIEDFRITKGYARYTGNFTVPDAPFAYGTSDINYKQWTPNNFSVTAGAGNDSLVDTPTLYGTDTGAGGEVRGNYCTLNPLRQATGSGAALANGNLQFTCISAPTGSQTTFATMGVSSGKWYFEMLVSTTGGTYYPGVGVNTDLALAPTSQSGDTASGYMYLINGQKYTNSTLSAYGASFTANDVIGVALDMDAGTITFYKNGSSQGQAFSGISGTAVPCVVGLSSAAGTLNFGQRPFAHTAPSGFKALVTTNLPEPTVLQGNDHFETLIWSGDDTDPRSFSTLDFSPGFTWIKQRNQAFSTGHQLYDVVRGAGSDKELNSSSTAAEGAGNIEQYGWVSSFDANGFSVTGGTLGITYVNAIGTNYVAWNWNAGGSNASNTDGTITSTVRANPTAGFSIVSYTGTGTTSSVGHGLGTTPAMIICKSRTSAVGWPTWHQAMGGTDKVITLNTDGAVQTISGYWGSAIDSTVFGLISGAYDNNRSGDSYIAYCFAEVPGYSAFGSYTGNGSNTAAPFVYLGFRPAFVLVKNATTGGASSDWWLFDNKRGVYNLNGSVLYPNLADAEYVNSSVFGMNFFSNGFQLNSNTGPVNQSGNTHIYAAFAENPFKNALAR